MERAQSERPKGIDDEGVDRAGVGAGAVFDFDPFLMARRFVEDGLGPILRRGAARGENERGAKNEGGGAGEAGKRVFHGGRIAERQGPRDQATPRTWT
jgi:hypothetical protein